MNILLLGASGFIGSALARSLVDAGHKVRGLGRDLAYAERILPQLDWIAGDLRQMARPTDWADALDGVNIVINASGALQTGLRDNVEAVQYVAMLALYEAAKQAKVGQVIQISAAGADDRGQSQFMGSKAAADAALVASGLGYCILRPGLVIGRNCFGGTELLRAVSALPLAQVTPSGAGYLQCVALSDVVEAVHVALKRPDASQGSFDLVEQQPRSLGEVVGLHRAWLGLPAPVFRFKVPLALVRAASKGADLLGWLGWRSPLRSSSITALVHGVRGDAIRTRHLLGRSPLSLPRTLDGMGPAGKADRWHARMAWLYPLALAVLLLLWLGSGLIGLLRTDTAAMVLIDGGMNQNMARFLVLAGSVADLAIAFGLLWRPWLAKALAGSIVLAFGYCIGALIWRADLWLDPLGPMLKVLPVLALSALCLAMADER